MTNLAQKKKSSDLVLIWYNGASLLLYQRQLDKPTKLQSMVNHELYTAAKTASTEDEEARLLQNYLSEREM